MIFAISDILQLKKLVIVKKIYSVNSLYLRITHTNGYIKERNENKYLIFDSVNENKELLKNIMIFLMELWTKLKK